MLVAFTDNEIVRATLQRHCASSANTAFWAAPLFESCARRRIVITSERISTDNNKLADFGSRLTMPGIQHQPCAELLNAHCKRLFSSRKPEHVPHTILEEAGVLPVRRMICPRLAMVDLNRHYTHKADSLGSKGAASYAPGCSRSRLNGLTVSTQVVVLVSCAG